MRSFSQLGGELVTVGQGSEGLPGNQPYCLLRAVGDGGCLELTVASGSVARSLAGAVTTGAMAGLQWSKGGQPWAR